MAAHSKGPRAQTSEFLSIANCGTGCGARPRKSREKPTDRKALSVARLRIAELGERVTWITAALPEVIFLQELRKRPVLARRKLGVLQ